MKFAFAQGDPGQASLTIFGAPYDLTSSFRPGSRFAPQRIRESSWGFESYIPELGLDLRDHEIADVGDLALSFDLKGALLEVESLSREIISEGSVPFMLGGEHSMTVGNLRCLDDISLLVFDAHLDYRAEYLDRDGHGCALRRIDEMGKAKNIVVLGARSYSRDEVEDLGERIEFYPPHEAEMGLQRFLQKTEKIYISIDMDVLDPAYAPGVANPEPRGITPSLIIELLDKAIDNCKIVGLDLVEISPPFDCNDITSLLGAWVAKEAIGRILAKSRTNK